MSGGRMEHMTERFSRGTCATTVSTMDRRRHETPPVDRVAPGPLAPNRGWKGARHVCKPLSLPEQLPLKPQNTRRQGRVESAFPEGC
jgi:hypothetical protein